MNGNDIQTGYLYATTTRRAHFNYVVPALCVNTINGRQLLTVSEGDADEIINNHQDHTNGGPDGPYNPEVFHFSTEEIEGHSWRPRKQGDVLSLWSERETAYNNHLKRSEAAKQGVNTRAQHAVAQRRADNEARHRAHLAQRAAEPTWPIVQHLETLPGVESTALNLTKMRSNGTGNENVYTTLILTIKGADELASLLNRLGVPANHIHDGINNTPWNELP